jgi:hypothetical protein
MAARRYIRLFNEIGLDDLASVGSKNACNQALRRILSGQPLAPLLRR